MTYNLRYYIEFKDKRKINGFVHEDISECELCERLSELYKLQNYEEDEEAEVTCDIE